MEGVMQVRDFPAFIAAAKWINTCSFNVCIWEQFGLMG